jgi:transcriptional regulator with XRE-family HTH domain
MRFNYYLLGEILKERRIEKGLSKNKLAQYVGISQPEVTRIENGIRTIPNIVTLIYFCEVLDLDFIELLKVTGFVDEKNLIMKGNFDMKKFKVNAKKDKKLEFIVYSESEEQALKIIEEVLEDLELSDDELEKISKIIIDVEEQELEERQEDFKEKSDKSMCETCEYFCSKCGRCTLE